MTSDTDHTLPGKAGLYFRTDALTPSGWQQEHEARQSLERWCDYCGQSACYGYGVSLTADGTWTCADAPCRASAKDEEAQRLCLSPPAEPLSPAAQATDLFDFSSRRFDATERGGRA